jgi:tetratricopeptide (TPR) repeat protein
MIFEWFNARDATSVGSALADSLLVNGTSAQDVRPAELKRLMQRATRDAQPLRLNVYKRAKLLGSFKWRLIERGVAQQRADELTHLLLVQISGGVLNSPQSLSGEGQFGAATAPSKPLKRIDPLLHAVDADFSRGAYDDAIGKLREVLQIKPNHAFAHNKLGDALCRRGRYAEAESSFRRALQIEPRRADAQINLGNLLRWRGNFSGSEATLWRAVKQDPRNADALISLGHTLSAFDRVEEAKDCFEKALRLKSRSASALCGLAWIESMNGRFEAAEGLLRRALEIDPDCSEALATQADLRRMTAEDANWLEQTRRVLSMPLPPMEEAKLRFAVGKYHDDLGEYAQAFEQYRRANELRRVASVPYDRQERVAYINDIIRLYTHERIVQPIDGAVDSARPVLVVGMMRSGTSLVEQIIASHHLAAGAGELMYWGAVGHKHPEFVRKSVPEGAEARKLADAYLRTLAKHSKDAERIVDKTPANVDYLGLILSVLPRARIVCMNRDPIDTCLSNYFQDFANAAAFAMDLEDLAHYYQEYHRLVAHWRSVLPREAFLEVPYAELVSNQEHWSRRIIEFVGLEWDPKVLEFHKTRRTVTTASNWQVRQKMYSSSVGRSKHYQKYIGPLLKLRGLSP